MRIRVTSGGIYGADGEVSIGTEFTVSSIPKGWAGRVEIVADNPKPDDVFITNPDPSPKPAPVKRGRPKKGAE